MPSAMTEIFLHSLGRTSSVASLSKYQNRNIMKVTLVFLVGLLVVGFTSCSETETVVTVHESTDIDLDGNGTIDYRIRYSEVAIEPLSITDGTYGVSGRLHPIGQNEILQKLQEQDLFLRDLDEIKKEVIEPLRWRSTFSSNIVSIATLNTAGDWPSQWEVESDSKHSTYFFGLKLVGQNQSRVGWLEVEIDESNGVVAVVDKGLL